MILNSPYVSGSLTVTGNITALGGISISGSIASASYASNAELLDGLDSSVFVLSSSFQNYSSSNDGKVAALNIFSASILSYTSSTDDRIAQLNRETASLNLATASINNATASLYNTTASLNAAVSDIRNATASLYNATASLYNATASLYAATASIYNFTSSANLRIGSLEQYTQSLNTRSASFACVTATNNFGCVQYFSNTSNAVSFTSTGSLYSDGGVRITRDMYVSGTAYFNNVTVFGTQSINYISSSQLNIASNIISVNTATPTVRFGGLAVYDSGSLGTGLTGSLLWDSEDNQWIYSNPSGSVYDSALFLVGPRNTGVLGNEPGISCNFLSKGNGMHHMTSSGIFEGGNATCFYGNTVINSSGSIISIPIAGTNTAIQARGGGDGSGQGKGNFRSSDQGGTNFWDFGRDNLSTGAFVISPSGSSSVFSITTNGTACFSNTVQANGKLFIQRASNGADTLVQFKNEAGVDRAYIKFGGTNEELAFYAGNGCTQNLMITSTGTSCFYGAVQSCDRVGTCDNQGFYLRGIGDSTHRLYYNTSDGSNVWEYNTSVKFNFYNTASPTTRMVLDTSGNMCVTNVISAGGCMGVRTTSPQDLLEVYGSTNDGINICASNQPRLGFFVGGTSANNKIWDFIPQSNNTFIARVVNDAKNSAATWISVTRNEASITSICFPQTNPMVISGCVGIGIVPNSAGLRLAACTVLRVEGACSGEVSPDNFGISLGGLGSLRIDAPGVGGGRFVVNSDGNVSIGNPTPANKLTVCGNDSGFQGCPSMRFYIARGCCQTVGSIIFTTGNTSVACGWAEIGQTDNNGDLYFKANSTIGNYTTRMVIKGDTGVTMFCCQFCAPAAHIVNCLGVGTAPGSAAFTTGNAGIANQNTYLGTGQLRVGGGSDHSSNQVLSIAPGVVGVDAPGVSNGRFVINSSGNVGIGTASPSDKLQVLGSLRWGGSSVNLVSSNDASGMYIENSGTTTTNRTIRIQGINDAGTRYSQFFVKAGSAEFCFVTEDAHRFSITSDGRSYFTCQLRVGTAGVATNFFVDASTAGCVVSGTPGTTNGNSISGMRLYNLCSATSNSLVGLWFSTGPHWAGLASGRCDHNSGWGTDIRFYTHEDNTANLDQSTERVRINAGGTVTFFGYGAGTLSTNSSGVISASDGRLKTKTRAIENGLCTIMQLEPTYYRWNEDTVFHTEYEELGFIAQEVSCIIPEASPEPEQEGKLKNYNDRAIIAMLTKGMQEQQCTINTLKTCLGIV